MSSFASFRPKNAEQGEGQFSTEGGKGVAVEEEEWGAAVALPQKFYELGEGEDLSLLFLPLLAARCLSLSIKAVLRASSCARSSVVADDRLPTPVFDKSGSGL